MFYRRHVSSGVVLFVWCFELMWCVFVFRVGVDVRCYILFIIYYTIIILYYYILHIYYIIILLYYYIIYYTLLFLWSILPNHPSFPPLLIPSSFILIFLPFLSSSPSQSFYTCRYLYILTYILPSFILPNHLISSKSHPACFIGLRCVGVVKCIGCGLSWCFMFWGGVSCFVVVCRLVFGVIYYYIILYTILLLYYYILLYTIHYYYYILLLHTILSSSSDLFFYIPHLHPSSIPLPS
jgi:hypothetical protein